MVEVTEELVDLPATWIVSRDGERLPLADFGELWGSGVRHPDLDGAEACGAHTLAV